jgi:hypothetical protein
MYSKLYWASCVLALAPFVSAQVQPFAPAGTATPVVAPVIPPIDGHARIKWLLDENLSIESELDDIVVGGAETFLKTPKEYGTHWEGFGERIGLVTADYALKSTMEVSLGSMWGEDPRYFRTSGLSMKSRMGYVIKMTFMAQNRAGKNMPAYSRFIAFPASSFIANEWTPHSQSNTSDAVVRVGLGFLSRMGENAWREFIVPRH